MTMLDEKNDGCFYLFSKTTQFVMNCWGDSNEYPTINDLREKSEK